MFSICACMFYSDIKKITTLHILLLFGWQKLLYILCIIYIIVCS